MKAPNFTRNQIKNPFSEGGGKKEVSSQWGTCCWCSRWAYRSCPLRRRRPWRTWWTGRRWTPWPRAPLSGSPSPEKREKRERSGRWDGTGKGEPGRGGTDGRSAFLPSWWRLVRDFLAKWVKRVTCLSPHHCLEKRPLALHVIKLSCWCLV